MRFGNTQDGQNHANERPGQVVSGPLKSRYPGELALRGLSEDPDPSVAGLITARFLTLQVAEHYATGWFVPEWLELAVAGVEPYVGTGCDGAPSDALRLRHLLVRMRVNQPERVLVGLLAAGDTALTHSAALAAYGFYRAAFELAMRIEKKVGAVSASSRLAGLAETLQRPRQARFWSKRCAQLVAECH